MEESYKILLIDGKHTPQEATANTLRAAGYYCDRTSEAVDIPQMLAVTPYDLLVLDIGESGNASRQLVHEAKKAAGGVPIILVTDRPTVETAVDALHLAFAAYLVTPLDLKQLELHVRRSVARGRMHRVVSGLQMRSTLWDNGVGNLQCLLQEPLNTNVMDLIGPVLTTTFEGLVSSVTDLRRVLDCLVATNPSGAPRSDIVELRNKLEIARTAVRETIGVLEETKHAFKSKRLGELRRQLQALLGILEQR